MLCRQVSLKIAHSRFRVPDDRYTDPDESVLNWVGYHGTRFTVVDATFNASNAQGTRELISVSRKNAVMENVQLLCPVKVTADLTNTTKYKLLCTTQCIHNEYKVWDITQFSPDRIKLIIIYSYLYSHFC